MLAYDQPIGRARAGAAQATPRTSAGFSVLELCRLLWRRRVAIAAAALICACAAVAIGKSLTPKYSATAQLYVDPRELQLVDRELTPRAQDISGLAMVVESQARLITSNNVLLQVIQQHQSRQGPRVRRRRPRASWHRCSACSGSKSRSADRDQARPDVGAGRPEPPRHRQENRPQLHRRYRRLVARSGEGGDARRTRSPAPI